MSRLKPRMKHIPLKFMGEGWEESYIQFRALSFADLATLDKTDESGKAVIDLLQRNFAGGRGVDAEGKALELTAADVADFDIETLTNLVKRLTGEIDPND